MTSASGPKGYYQALALYRSTDGGSTWTTTKANASSSYARAIAVDPAQEKALFMSFTDYDTGRYGLVKSVDGGATWKNVPTGGIDQIVDLEFDPLNSRRIYLCSESSGFYRSDNGGLSWQKMMEDGACFVLVSKRTSRKIFVTQHNAVYVSGDQGKTWEKIDIGSQQNDECLSLSYDETRRILYVGTEGGGILKKQL